MKKIAIFGLVSVLCAVAVGLTIFGLDKQNPVISLKDNNPTISCETTFESLLDNVSATDKNGIKELFIEEKSLAEIIEKSRFTYVAIDGKNNVSKKEVYVNIPDEVKNKKISVLKELVLPLGEEFRAEEYFSITNECGTSFDDIIKVTGLNTKVAGDYEITVSAINDTYTEPLVVVMKVADLESPRIILKATEFELEYGQNLYFNDVVERFEDNKDSFEYLKENMQVDSNVNIYLAGEYHIKYTIMDSDGNIATAEVKVTVKPEEKPVEPSEPTGPSVPNEPTVPSEPETPSEPEQPSQPEEPEQPEEPVEPDTPTDPAE